MQSVFDLCFIRGSSCLSVAYLTALSASRIDQFEFMATDSAVGTAAGDLQEIKPPVPAIEGRNGRRSSRTRKVLRWSGGEAAWPASKLLARWIKHSAPPVKTRGSNANVEDASHVTNYPRSCGKRNQFRHQFPFHFAAIRVPNDRLQLSAKLSCQRATHHSLRPTNDQ